MLNVIIVIHLLLALAMVGVILLQRSEGGALGIGGGGGVMSGRAAGNLLTRATGILATGFFITSLGLALLSNDRGRQGSIMDAPIETQAPQPQAPQQNQPQQPQQPAAPISH
ncbi:MAG TPA: preprotein translocase subunit SecG [Magnetospirillaceae bacterium]|nr:preprotein translocase subunit SecG [Magnetospirillaceae bacterium]